MRGTTGDDGAVRAGTSALVAVAAAAAVVLIGALVGAVLLRAHGAAPRSTGGTPPTSASVTCAGAACQLLASADAGDSVAQLFADPRGGGGHVTFGGQNGNSVFQIGITDADVVLTTHSLSCVSGAVPACLVAGDYADQSQRSGSLGEVFVRHGGYWQQPGSTFLYSSAGTFTLVAAADGGDPAVVAVQHDCGQATVADKQGRCAQPDLIIQLFAADGTSLGCTLSATSVTLLPGRGTDVPPSYDLHTCPPSTG
jgi:hypothetical protein